MLGLVQWLEQRRYMNKVTEFLTEGTVTLKEVESPINGKLSVRWDMSSGFQIMGGRLWQVGGPVKTVWVEAFKKLPDDFHPKKLLIIGLGGGTIAALARKKWSKIDIVGVDIDPVIVGLGTEYLGLGKLSVDTHIADAYEFIHTQKKSFELVCLDTYVGSTFPEKFASDAFLLQIKRVLKKNGIGLFNRLYDGRDRARADKFEKQLERVFGNVMAIYPKPEELANAVYLVRQEG